VLAGDEPPLGVRRVAVGAVGGLAPDLEAAGIGPLVDAVGGDVAEEETPLGLEPGGPFGKLQVRGDSADLGARLGHLREGVVEDLDPGGGFFGRGCRLAERRRSQHERR